MIKISDIELSICNPFYLSMIVYIVILCITLYSFNSNDINLYQHVKFFIYSFLFLVLYNLYLSDFYTKKLKQEYRLESGNTSFQDFIKN